MKPVLFRRILLSYLLITPLLLISLEFYLSGTVKDNYISNLKESLTKQGRLLADQIPVLFTNNLDAFCKKYKQKTGARITIINSSGKVLGDSDEPSDLMENHSDRQEIRDADISDVGSSIRYSKTLQKNLLYLAIAVNRGSEKNILRLSVPLHDVETAMKTIRIRIIVASFAVTFVVIVFGLIQIRRLTRSIEEITAFSKDVAAGNFRKRLFLKEKGELAELGMNISDMAGEINNKLLQSDEEKQKIEAILRNMSDGLVLADKTGTILLSNDAIRNLFGIQSDVQGKTLLEALRNAELMEIVENVVSSKGKILREISISQPKELYLMATATPFYSSQGERDLSGVVLTFHDITRLRKLEEIRKDFVANVSHEIKTPITAIKGFAETLLEGALDDKQDARRFLETIKNNSERLNSLVSDLLTLSRIELGDVQIDKKAVNLNELVDSVFTTLGEKARRKGLYLKKNISSEIYSVQADRDRLIQIVLNLVDNGIKFTEKGEVTVTVKAHRTENIGLTAEESGLSSPGGFIEISVIDTGIGIPKKYLSRLGERFYRVDRARSREFGGTGLGLAIVKHLVIAHGWEMKIESVEGSGTTVHIICPLT